MIHKDYFPNQRVYLRRVLKASLLFLLTYSLFLIGFYIAMCQKPEVFSRIMSRTSSIAFMAFPFKMMWFSARKGYLKVGDSAPGFSLETYDKKSRVQLSALK